MVAAGRIAALAVLVLLVSMSTTALAGPGLAGPQPETDNTVTRIAVEPDGDARWTVRIRTRLATQDDVDSYRAFQERFRNDTAASLDPFRDRLRAVVASAANATGREMRAVNFTATTSIQQVPRRWGVVSYSFTWEGFAAGRGDALVVGDVFEGGLLITEDDTLAVRAPPEYTVGVVDPAPTRREDDTLTWVGRVDFADERPRVRFVPAGRVETTANPQAVTATPPTGADPDVDSGLMLWLAGLFLALVTVVGVLLWRREDGPADAGGDAIPGHPPESDGVDGRTEADTSAPAEPLLPDEERVLDLLAAEGGRMRQADIADRFGWSASKTSRTVSALTEDGEVQKLRIGRENVVSLAGTGEDADGPDGDEPRDSESAADGSGEG